MSVQIERLKSQLTQQESSKQAQNEELASLREQLESLKKEEREYKLKVDATKAELEKLQKSNLSLQSDMSQVPVSINIESLCCIFVQLFTMT